MSKVIFVLIYLVSFNSYSNSMKLKPGLWEIKMQIFHNGKEIDPLGELKKELEKMPEAQRKLILEQMTKGGSNQNVTNVCYTKEMVDSPDKIVSEEDSDCDHKVKSQTAKKIVSEFKCEDGSRGTTIWEMVNPTQTKVTTDAVDKKGKKTQMKYEAKFIKSKC